MNVITEAYLRTRYLKNQNRIITLQKDDFITRTAMDFIREKKLSVIYEDETDCKPMNEKTSDRTKKYKYVDNDGNEYVDKPEHMTHLYGNILVFKNHPRIKFRGKLDTLQSKILEIQLLAHENGKNEIVNDLDEILQLTRNILASEVKQEPLEKQKIMGLDEKALREVSHNPKKHYGIEHYIPDYTMGKIVIALNLLRTIVRETELFAIDAFLDSDGEIERLDLIEMLNRMSSAVYIISCRVLSDQYKNGI